MDAEHQQHRRGLQLLVDELVAQLDPHHRCCFLPRPWEVAASATLTSTVMPRLSPGNPIQVPESGTACRGCRVTATRIRLRLPTMPLVGSNSIQPAPGR